MPALQAVGAELPAAHQEEVGHGEHASSPSSFWKVPASHLLHALKFALGATVPGLHLVCSVLPVCAKEPASVFVHPPALVRPVELE